MVMFAGMGKHFWGLRVSFFMDLKFASKNCLRLITLLPCFSTTVLVFDKRQVKWLQARKEKFQETNINKLRGSRSQLPH